MRRNPWVTMLLVAVALTALPACKAPAEFEVMSLDITPPEVRAGDTVTISAKVRNTGGTGGIYAAVLTVDGVEVETEDVTVAPGAAETVHFSVVKDQAGIYTAAIGELSSSFAVKEKQPALVAEEIELKYDDGKARDFLATGVGGYLVAFTPPDAPFTIQKTRIYGALFGTGWEGREFELEIWDKGKQILHNATYSVTKFGEGFGGVKWVEIEIPDIEVTDEFYVHVHTATMRMQGIHVGADDSVINEHSELTIRTPRGETDVLGQEAWPLVYAGGTWFKDKSKVNWMIRVVGTIMVPEE